MSGLLSSLVGNLAFWGIIIGLAAAFFTNKFLMAKIPTTINAILKTVVIDVLDVIVCAFFVFILWPTHDIFTALFAIGVGAAWRYLIKLILAIWAKISAVTPLV